MAAPRPPAPSHVQITSVPPATRVNDKGQVVEIKPGRQGSGSGGTQGGRPRAPAPRAPAAPPRAAAPGGAAETAPPSGSGYEEPRKPGRQGP